MNEPLLPEHNRASETSEAGVGQRQEEQESSSVSFREKMVIVMGSVAIAPLDQIRNIYSTIFFLDIVKMSAVDYGNIILISRLWDAVTDPAM